MVITSDSEGCSDRRTFREPEFESRFDLTFLFASHPHYSILEVSGSLVDDDIPRPVTRISDYHEKANLFFFIRLCQAKVRMDIESLRVVSRPSADVSIKVDVRKAPVHTGSEHRNIANIESIERLRTRCRYLTFVTAFQL